MRPTNLLLPAAQWGRKERTRVLSLANGPYFTLVSAPFQAYFRGNTIWVFSSSGGVSEGSFRYIS